MVTVAGVGSAVLMAVLFIPGWTPRGSTTAPTRACSTSWRGPPSPSWPRRGASRTLRPGGPCTGGPRRGGVLGVFWVIAGTPRPAPNFMFEGGFLLCAVLAAVVVADARLLSPGRFARALAWAPAALPGHHLLRHLPVALADVRLPQRGPDRAVTLPLDIIRVVVTLGLATASYYLVEQPVRRRLPGGLAPLAGPRRRRRDRRGMVLATIPAVADPSGWPPRPYHHVDRGDRARAPVDSPGRPDRAGSRHLAANPLRVVVLGDSVMHDAYFAINAALGSTGEVDVTPNTIDGFGLTTATNGRPRYRPSSTRRRN